jgi:hypothetical protein
VFDFAGLCRRIKDEDEVEWYDQAHASNVQMDIEEMGSMVSIAVIATQDTFLERG